MRKLFVFRALAQTRWLQALWRLEEALSVRDSLKVSCAYAELYGALVEVSAPDVVSGAAHDLLYLESGLADAATRAAEIPEGLREGARFDLEAVLSLIRRDWPCEVDRLQGPQLPPLERLAPEGAGKDGLEPFKELLYEGSAEDVLAHLIRHYQQHGAGPLARDRAFRWQAGELVGIRYPAWAEMETLVGLGRPLTRLCENTEAFLEARGAQHTLLYGARGSGKSTAVRSLLRRYGDRGLRLIELPPSALADLPQVLELVRFRPHRYIFFVDDLSFEASDSSYAPLKTLLEGSLTQRPENVLVYATSNRRHLVSERFSDRPDPLDDDVHAWDTHNERLALADRFGLTITFPSATQQRYLEIVRGLAARRGLERPDLEERALRYAEWGNGYSGRVAQQFIDTLG